MMWAAEEVKQNRIITHSIKHPCVHTDVVNTGHVNIWGNRDTSPHREFWAICVDIPTTGRHAQLNCYPFRTSFPRKEYGTRDYRGLHSGEVFQMLIMDIKIDAIWTAYTLIPYNRVSCGSAFEKHTFLSSHSKNFRDISREAYFIEYLTNNP